MTARTSAVHLFSAALLLAAPGLHAQTDESRAVAQRLVIRSGLAVQLRGINDQIVNDIRTAPASSTSAPSSAWAIPQDRRFDRRCCSRT